MASDLEGLRKGGKILAYRIRGSQVCLYLKGLKKGEQSIITMGLKALYPAKISTPPCRVYEYNNPLREAWAKPLRLTIHR